MAQTEGEIETIDLVVIAVGRRHFDIDLRYTCHFGIVVDFHYLFLFGLNGFYFRQDGRAVRYLNLIAVEVGRKLNRYAG